MANKSRGLVNTVKCKLLIFIVQMIQKLIEFV